MNDEATVRKLRAIMFSDIVGYSKMMQHNESEALKLLQKHKDIVSEISAKYSGKIIKYVGDEILVESESAVMLVYCAKELQKFFADRNATVPKSRELWVRIGIHIGDVVVKEDDIFGDGVNIASRIRPLAQPGGIVITHSVLILLGNQDDIKCELLGNKKLKNIKEKIKIYEVITGQKSVPTLGLEKSSGIDRDTLLKKILPVSMTVLFLFFLLFLIFRTSFSDYEEEYFKSELNNANGITRKIESVKNVKANYFNIISSSVLDSPALMNYYDNMQSQNPANMRVRFYATLMQMNFNSDRFALDSAFTVFEKLDEYGVKNPYFKISRLKLYNKLNVKSASAALAEDIIEEYPDNPLTIFEAAETYKNVLKNDEKAERLYRRTLELFPEFVGAYNGLSDIEFNRRNFNKAKSLSDSSLAINPTFLPSVRTAVRTLKSLSEFNRAYEIVDVLPQNSPEKYLEKAKISLLDNNPSEALRHISDGLYEFPDKQDFVEANSMIEKIIVLSDSIQRIENTVTRGSNKWTDSWEDAVQISKNENKPIIVIALDSESLRSKYIELALLERGALRLTNEAVMLKVFRHSDQDFLNELGVETFPTMLLVSQEKEVIKSYENTKDVITDSDVVISFVTEAIFLNKKIVAMERDIEDNRYKNAKDFLHAEELALEHSLPIIAVLTSRESAASDMFLKQTIFNPGFMKNFNRTVLLSVEDAKSSDLAKKHNVNKFPTVLIFDEDINLVSRRYGVIPQKILSEEINRIKLFRKRNEKIKETVNWTYDIKEALSFARSDNKPLLAYITEDPYETFEPEGTLFDSYETVKKINSGYIPLFISSDTNREFFKNFSSDALPAVAVLDHNGQVLYSTIVPDEDKGLDHFLDYKTNGDLLVSLGSKKFKNMQTQVEVAKALVAGKMKRSARNKLIEIITSYPSLPCGYTDLGELFLSLNEFGSSVYYLKFLEDKHFPVSERYLKLLLTSSLLWDDFFRLDEYLNLLLKKFKNDRIAQSSIYAALAELYLAENETIDALNYAEQSFSLDPVRMENLNLMGILNYRINREKSEEYFKISLVVNPENTVANAYMYKITGEKKYLIDSKKSYHSGDTDFLGLRFFDDSKEFTNKGLIELIEQAYRIRLLMYPENTDFKLDLVRFLAENNGDLSEALEMANQLLKADPDNIEFLTAASWVFYNLGDFSGADRIITKAFRSLSPEEYENFSSMFYYMGMIKSSIGDNRSARYYFERLLEFKNREDIGHNKLEFAKRFIESVH
jgi:class 3 adenylate cyclase/tetratricopeptide (TPR) repeat protein